MHYLTAISDGKDVHASWFRLGPTVLACFLVFAFTAFSQVTIYVSPTEENVSPAIQKIVSSLQRAPEFSGLVRISPTTDADYYLIFKPETDEVLLFRRGLRIELIKSASQKEVLNAPDEYLYDILLNHIGIPLRNVISDGTVRFVSPFVYADAYVIRGNREQFITKFRVNYLTGEVIFDETVLDVVGQIFPVNTFAGISGRFSEKLMTLHKVTYLQGNSLVSVSNTSRRDLYIYLFSPTSLYRGVEVVARNSSVNIRINWRDRKAYLAVSEEKLTVDSFERFLYALRLAIRDSKAIIYALRFPEERTFQTLKPPSLQSIDYDYQKRGFSIEISDPDYLPGDQYVIILNGSHEFSFRSPRYFFEFAQPIRTVELVKRRSERGVTFESVPVSAEIKNTAPDILVERLPLRNGQSSPVSLVDLDGDTVRVVKFETLLPGLRWLGGVLVCEKVPIGEHEVRFTLSDGKTEVVRTKKITVANSPPRILNLTTNVHGEGIQVTFLVLDPDPQRVTTVAKIQNDVTGEFVKKEIEDREGYFWFNMIGQSGQFSLILVSDDGETKTVSEGKLSFSSNYSRTTEKKVDLKVAGVSQDKKTVLLVRGENEEVDEVRLFYTVSRTSDEPQTFWQLVNSDDLNEVTLTGQSQLIINAQRSGYYHFGFLAIDRQRCVYYQKLEPILINRSPSLSVVNVSQEGFQNFVNIAVYEPDNDDLSVYATVKNVDTGETESILFEERTNVLNFQFAKAGVYFVEIFAVDRYGSFSNKESFTLRVPPDLPRFTRLSPSGTALKPRPSVELRWELEATNYTIPVTFEVYVGESPSLMRLLTTTKNRSVSLSVTPGKSYYWKVIARYSSNLFVESQVAEFIVEKEAIVEKRVFTLQGAIAKVLSDRERSFRICVIQSDGTCYLSNDVREGNLVRLGKLVSTVGEFWLSAEYLLNYTSRSIYLYDLGSLKVTFWASFDKDILFAGIFGGVLAVITVDEISIRNLSDGKTTVLKLPDISPTTILPIVYFDRKSNVLILPSNSYAVFVDLKEPKLLRQFLIRSRNSIFYCDLIRDDMLLTIDISGQVNVIRIRDGSAIPVSTRDIGVSYPMGVSRMETGLIVYSRTGKVSLCEWDTNGVVRIVLNELREDLSWLAAPSSDTVVYVTRNRIEFYAYNNISLLKLLEIRNLPFIPMGFLNFWNYVVVHNDKNIVLYELNK